MRKALDMDYELAKRFGRRRQQEIEDSERGAPVATDKEILAGARWWCRLMLYPT